MTVLIVYGTIEGQTGKIAHFIEDVVKAGGHDTKLIDTAALTTRLPLEEATHVILAASVHERRHPRPFEVFVAAQRHELANHKTLMLSISLKAAFSEGQEDAQEYLTEMLMRTQFEPDSTALVAGAVRPGSYGYFETEIIRHVVLEGQDFDPTEGVREFTDWDALAATVKTFVKDEKRPAC